MYVRVAAEKRDMRDIQPDVYVCNNYAVMFFHFWFSIKGKSSKSFYITLELFLSLIL